MAMQESLNAIMNDLKSLEERREKILKGTRDVVMFCRKSIVLTHAARYEEAKEQADKAMDLLEDLRKEAKYDLQHYLINTEAEIVEARVLHAIARREEIPSCKELQIDGAAYILGLLDCIGEMKRMAYDMIRENGYDHAICLFKQMEEIYSLLFPFSAYDNIVQGVRRKLDLARILIESVREVITEESRRRLVLDAVEKLKEK